ncbi:3-oxoacyl-ACP synthase II [Streptococcus criceti]|uniref:3-oxoacyl-[acyl-carrier-protein] synthase 2 n=1 Tax=Streptococcus criceti HS-6 TaxID=873449 RepID=G5JQ56_STRCG|nr:beta-ketoacyl-ACP synthase II [Streptococcus criceti]EHI75530.1 3-oxoacyl-(acyl carrier protein) synthase II [Streptococcus criceti HS-6]SUN43155.1 3-oxoacyl-ACP synthase II [Streptococcus criceti]
MNKNRVVITGYGITSAIGNNPQEFWTSLESGKIGIGPITRFDTSSSQVVNAGQVQNFPFDKYFGQEDLDKKDLSGLYAIYAAQEAFEAAGLTDQTGLDYDRIGVMISSTVGGLQEFQEQIIAMNDLGMTAISPDFVSKAFYNMPAANVAISIGAKGSCKSISTACSSSNDAIGQAFREIKRGSHDIILAGGAEAPITEIGVGGFDALTAVSRTQDPNRASIPFDKDRNGFVIGEGAGVLVLESLEHAQARGATILAEVIGYGNNCDAYHVTSPSPGGLGAAKAIRLALNDAQIQPDQVDYVNAHGTSTPANDLAESQAIVSVLGKEVPVSSTKSFTGHLQGATGGVEAIATIQAINHNFVPMTAGTRDLGDDIEANIIIKQGYRTKIKFALSNTFGFGGSNAVLVFKKWEN